jgi:hypothetical protein
MIYPFVITFSKINDSCEFVAEDDRPNILDNYYSSTNSLNCLNNVICEKLSEIITEYELLDSEKITYQQICNVFCVIIDELMIIKYFDDKKWNTFTPNIELINEQFSN